MSEPIGAITGIKYWLVTISDGTNTYQLIVNNVEWPLQGDNFLVLKFDTNAVPVDFLQQLDEWEENGTELTVSAVAKCDDPMNSMPQLCSAERLDYDGFDGKAKIIDKRNCVTIEETDEQGNTTTRTVCGGWVYNPTGQSEIPLLFSEIE